MGVLQNESRRNRMVRAPLPGHQRHLARSQHKGYLGQSCAKQRSLRFTSRVINERKRNLGDSSIHFSGYEREKCMVKHGPASLTVQIEGQDAVVLTNHCVATCSHSVISLTNSMVVWNANFILACKFITWVI